MARKLASRDVLAKAYLFTQASPEDRAALTALAEPRVYSAGDHLYDAGDRADALYMISLGTVDIVGPGKTVPVMTVGSDQLFGELPFFEAGERAASAIARETTRAHRIAYDALAKVLAERPGLERLVYRNACRFMVKHIRQMAQEINHRYL